MGDDLQYLDAIVTCKTTEEKALQAVLIDKQRAKATGKATEGPNTLRSSPAGCPGSPVSPEPDLGRASRQQVQPM